MTKMLGKIKVKSTNLSRMLLLRYYYLLFGIQNLREAMKNAKHVMTKEYWTNSLQVKAQLHICHLKHILLKHINRSSLMNTNCWTTKQQN